MFIESRNLGKIDYSESDVLTFEKGILAFEDEKQFIVVRNEDTEFYYMQSVNNPDVTFVLVDLKDVMPNYDPEVEVEQIKDLGEIKNNLNVFNVCTLKEKLEEMTVNLAGPIVINMDTKKGKQVIVAKGDSYTVKHKLFS